MTVFNIKGTHFKSIQFVEKSSKKEAERLKKEKENQDGYQVFMKKQKDFYILYIFKNKKVSKKKDIPDH